jgi:hypothetical protein
MGWAWQFSKSEKRRGQLIIMLSRSAYERRRSSTSLHGLSRTRQAQFLKLSRASLYYEPVGTSEEDLRLMRRIDELHLPMDFTISALCISGCRSTGTKARVWWIFPLRRSMSAVLRSKSETPNACFYRLLC